MARPADPDILLCERCGYPIGGLDAGGSCPECGLSLAASDPARRVGSPWQRKPSVRSWAATLARIARRPRELFGVVRVDGVRAIGLLRVNLMLAGILAGLAVVAPVFLITVHGSGFGATDESLTFFFAWAIAGTGGYFLFWVLTRIEWLGIRLFGTRRGWRITAGAATTVVAHASYGWVGAGVLALAGSIGAEAIGVWGLWLGAAAGGFVVGLLAFEVLVYLGVRRVRFANARGAWGVFGAASDPSGPGDGENRIRRCGHDDQRDR